MARRMIIFASEDVGNADPQALQVAVAAAHAVEHVGMPEGSFALGQAAIYLSLAPKSDGVGRALGAARAHVREHGAPRRPPRCARAAYPGAAKLGRGTGYDYRTTIPGTCERPAPPARGARGPALLRPGRTARRTSPNGSSACAALGARRSGARARAAAGRLPDDRRAARHRGGGERGGGPLGGRARTSCPAALGRRAGGGAGGVPAARRAGRARRARAARRAARARDRPPAHRGAARRAAAERVGGLHALADAAPAALDDRRLGRRDRARRGPARRARAGSRGRRRAARRRGVAVGGAAARGGGGARGRQRGALLRPRPRGWAGDRIAGVLPRVRGCPRS